MTEIIKLDLVECINLLPAVKVMLEDMATEGVDGAAKNGLQSLFDRVEAAIHAETERRLDAGKDPLSADEIKRLGAEYLTMVLS